MSAPEVFPQDLKEFHRIREQVAKAVALSGGLPESPFVFGWKESAVFEYDVVLSDAFGAVLAELTRRCGDSNVALLGLNPTATYYREGYGFYPALHLSAARVRAGWTQALFWEPDGDPTGSLAVSLNTVAAAGDSGEWAVWAQRDWEVGVLAGSFGQGFRVDDAPSHGADIDLDQIRSPSGWGCR